MPSSKQILAFQSRWVLSAEIQGSTAKKLDGVLGLLGFTFINTTQTQYEVVYTVQNIVYDTLTAKNVPWHSLISTKLMLV